LQEGAISFWHVSAHEWHARLQEARDKVDVTGKAVELGNHKDCFCTLGQAHGLSQLCAIGLAARLDLCELSNQLLVTDVLGDSLALCIKASVR